MPTMSASPCSWSPPPLALMDAGCAAGKFGLDRISVGLFRSGPDCITSHERTSKSTALPSSCCSEPGFIELEPVRLQINHQKKEHPRGNLDTQTG